VSPESYDVFPTADLALQMETPVLGDYVFDFLRKTEFSKGRNGFSGSSVLSIFQGSGEEQLAEKASAALSHLQTIGLVYPILTQANFFKISPEGREITSPSAARDYRLRRMGDPTERYERAIHDLNTKSEALLKSIQAAADSAIEATTKEKESADQYALNIEKRLRETALKVSVKAAQDEFSAAEQSNKKKAIY